MEPNVLSVIVVFIIASIGIYQFLSYASSHDKTLRKNEKTLDRCAYWWYNNNCKR